MNWPSIQCSKILELDDGFYIFCYKLHSMKDVKLLQ